MQSKKCSWCVWEGRRCSKVGFASEVKQPAFLWRIQIPRTIQHRLISVRTKRILPVLPSSMEPVFSQLYFYQRIWGHRLTRTSFSSDYFLLVTRLNSGKLLPKIYESKKKAPIFPGSATEMASKIVFNKLRIQWIHNSILKRRGISGLLRALNELYRNVC